MRHGVSFASFWLCRDPIWYLTLFSPLSLEQNVLPMLFRSKDTMPSAFQHAEKERRSGLPTLSSLQDFAR